MRFHTSLTVVLLIVAAGTTVACAQNLYWDIDVVSRAGAGTTTTPTGTWASFTKNWNTDSSGLGVPGQWVAGRTAVFSAGTNATGIYNVTVSGTQSLAGITVEEGFPTQNGVGTLAFGSGSAAIDVASGAGFGQTTTGILSGTGGIVKTGAGVLALRGANAFSQAGTGNQAFLSIEGGTVDFATDANLGAVPSATNNAAALTINGGTLRYSGTSTFALAANRGVTIGPSGGTIEIQNTAIIALAANAPAAAALSGNGNLTKTGTGRLRLQTAQTTFTGKYFLNGGSLAFSDQNRLGALPAAVQADYFTLNGGGIYADNTSGLTIDARRGITLGANGGVLSSNTGTLTYDGIIAGTQGGPLVFSPNDAIGGNTTGTIVLGSANTYNGPTQIDAGMTLSIGNLVNGGINSSIGSSSSAAGNLIFNGGWLFYRGGATSTDRKFSVTTAGGMLDASGTNNSALSVTSTDAITWLSTGTHLFILRGTSTGDNSFSPAITDQSAAHPTTFNKSDAGTWVLKNTANSYTGNTVLSNGRLKLGASGVLPDASTVQFFVQSVLDLNGFDETVKSISGSSGTIALGSKTLTLNNPNGETFAAAITGTGSGRIVKNGTGKLTLSPSSAAYDGGVTLNAGTLVLGTNTALGTGTFVVNNSATLAAASATTVFPLNPVKLAGDLTFDDWQAGATGSIVWGAGGNGWTISGGDRTITVNSTPGGLGARIDQPIGQDLVGLSLIKKGNGTLTLNGANTYTGNTIIWDGTVSISKAFMADWAGVALTSAAKLNLNFAPGVTDTVNSLYIDGAEQALGTWGAIGSAAEHQSSLFTGTGLLNVIPWGAPPTAQPLPGDFNNDGKVDMGDYVTWRKANGTNSALLNDDGLGVPVGQAHLDLWRQRFGTSRGSSTGGGLAGGTIPEPTTGLLLAIAIAGMWCMCSCRPRSRP